MQYFVFIALPLTDAREEFKVLHWQQLVNARRIIYPNGPPFPTGNREPVIQDFAKKSNNGVQPDGPIFSHQSLDSFNTMAAGNEEEDKTENIEFNYRTSSFALALGGSEHRHRMRTSGGPSLGGSLRSIRLNIGALSNEKTISN